MVLPVPVAGSRHHPPSKGAKRWTVKTSEMERQIRARLDALPEGWGSEAFRAALIAEARAKSPGPQLETLAISSREEATFHLEQLDVPAAVEAMKNRIAAELLVESWHPPAVDMSAVEQEIDLCVNGSPAWRRDSACLSSTLAGAAAHSVPENLPPQAQKEIGVPRSTDADLVALAHLEAIRDNLRPFLNDLNLYRRHRSETDAIQMVRSHRRRTDRPPTCFRRASRPTKGSGADREGQRLPPDLGRSNRCQRELEPISRSPERGRNRNGKSSTRGAVL